MFELQCTVRNCCETLTLSSRGLTCPRGHHFDRAREGYWSLLQPQDRRSKNPGDPDSAVLARHRWLSRGYVDGLIQMIRPWVARSAPNTREVGRTLDLGCGEGSFGPALFGDESQGYCGIDLSKRAIKLASKNWPSATWVLANADRSLPASNQSVDRVLSLFGRRPVTEIVRVLKDDAVCLVAVPAEDDLIELREQVQRTGQRRSRWEKVAEEMTAAGLSLEEHQTWLHHVELGSEAISDAMAMTYRGGRYSEQERLKSVKKMTVTLSADLLFLTKRSDGTAPQNHSDSRSRQL